MLNIGAKTDSNTGIVLACYLPVVGITVVTSKMVEFGGGQDSWMLPIDDILSYARVSIHLHLHPISHTDSCDSGSTPPNHSTSLQRSARNSPWSSFTSVSGPANQATDRPSGSYAGPWQQHLCQLPWHLCSRWCSRVIRSPMRGSMPTLRMVLARIAYMQHMHMVA